MHKKDCIFCKIAQWDIPCVKIWENDKFMAILDIFPSVEWMTVVIPKDHHDSDIVLMEDTDYNDIFLAAKEVVAVLKKWLWVDRVGMIVEWLQVNHAHVKLYPFRDERWFHGSVLPWPQATIEQLQQVAAKILK